jgi:hypothetical protein
MPWQQAAQPQSPRPAGTVPDGESVRLAALQATWLRDRQVARRRLWWRWFVWGARRYVLPLLAGLLLMAALWVAAHAALVWLSEPQVAHQPEVVATQQAAIRPTPIDAPETEVANLPADRKPMRLKSLPSPTGVALMYDAALPEHASSIPAPPSLDSPTGPSEVQNPQLISENWLHSKEP